MTRSHLLRAALVSVALAPAACDRCGNSGSNGTSSTDAADAAKPTPARKRPSDVTFLVISDTHFGFGGIEAAHEVLVPKLNHIAGRVYPDLIGGVVAIPRGLLVTGDLTEWGKVEEWEPFVATYGLTGKEGKVGLPVFEVIGNHDRVHGPWVEQQVDARHGGGRTFAVAHITDDRMSVASFDWDRDTWADAFYKALPLPKAR